MNTGAIWWRVSMDEQLEVSPFTQIKACRELAANDGADIPQENILGTDWSSLEVWDCPDMQQLVKLIRNQAITHLYSYHSDRLPAKPSDRLKLMALCSEYGVKVRCKEGQRIEGEMEEVGDFLSAWAKERQVLRAQHGAKDGLSTVARELGRPTTFARPLGYQWVRNEKGTVLQVDGKRRLKADDSFPIVQYIWQRALSGATLHQICRELQIQGFLTARGGQWYPSTVSAVLRNPVYAGRYAALRYEAKAPAKRKPGARRRSGKTSSQRLTPEDWVFLENVVVDPPVVTWVQFEAVQRRLLQNRDLALALATAKHDYLLVGMLWCGDCGKVYYSHTGPRGFYYRCSSQRRNLPEKCANPGLEQEITEQSVKSGLIRLFSDPKLIEAELERGVEGDTLSELEARRSAMQRQLAKAKDAEVTLLLDKAKGVVNLGEEIYQMAAARLKAERTWVAEELERIEEAIAAMKNREYIIAQIRELSAGIKNHLANASFSEWRKILEDLQVRLVVKDGKMMLYGNADAIVSGASVTVSTSPEF